MITYVNKNADVKNFNIWALSVNRTMKQKEFTINNMIRYLEQTYRSYVKHYNELQDLQKYIDNLTGESRYSSRDYSYYSSMNISSTFNINFGNVRLIKNTNDELIKFKNCIEDVRKNLLDIQVEIKETSNKIIKEIDPYKSMYNKTNDIREHGSSIVSNILTNISTALSEDDITDKIYQEMKDLAERETTEKEKVLKEEEEQKSDSADSATPSNEEAEKAAEKAAENTSTSGKKLSDLQQEAKKAQKEEEEATKLYNGFKNDFNDSDYTDYIVTENGNDVTYKNPITKETFHYTYDDTYQTYSQTYTDKYNNSVNIESTADKRWIVSSGGSKYTYDSNEEAVDAANKLAGKDVFKTMEDGGLRATAHESYEKSKQEAKDKAEKAKDKAKKANDAVTAAESDSSDNGSGGI